MATTKIRTEQAGVPSGGSAGQALIKSSGTDYDVTWGNVTGGGVGNLAEQFDDFINGVSIDGADFLSSGNFILGDNVPSEGTLVSELDHPGIVRMTSVNDYLTGFRSRSGSPTGMLRYDNDFDITILSRFVPVSTFTAQWILVGDTDTITLEITQAAVSYDIGGGVVPTAVAVPTSNTWFEVRFTMVSGTLTAYVDNDVVYSGSPGFVDGFYISVNLAGVGGGIDLDTDWVRTIYRDVPSNGIRSNEISISSAEIQTLNASPITLIPAPGAGKAIVPMGVTYSFTYGTVQYTAGNDVRTSFSTTLGNALDSGIGVGQINAASSSITNCAQPFGNDDAIVENDSVVVRNIGAEYATGDGTLKITIVYNVINV